MNELHNRLEYLVSYSSQLIFIGCDSHAQQQAALQGFLSIQHDNVDVAYVTGESEFENNHFRRQIYQQLLKESGSSHLPLDSHLINNLSADMGPVLICICGAEHISEELLNELWSTVVRNKDQAGGHHLNVLLFASSQWTQDAKISLSERHAHIPILLSTETVASDNPLLSLDNSITQNRARIRAKLLQENPDSLIQQAWFKMLMGALFMLFFGAIIYWQYPQEISRFLQPTYRESELAAAGQRQSKQQEYTELAETDLPDPLLSLDSDPSQILQEIQETQEMQQTPAALIVANTPTTNPQVTDISAQQSPEVKKVADQQASQNTDLQSIAEQSERLVTDWQIEVEKINRLETKSEQSQPQKELDITAVELNQLPSNPLQSLNDNSYVLQLAAMSDVTAMQAFIAGHNLTESSWTYTTHRFGGDWHVIVYAKIFDDLQQARNYVSSLPESINRSQPFAKSSQQIKEELSAFQQP